MPTYTYQCDCGVQFEARNTAAKHADPMPCPACKAHAPRTMPETVSSIWRKDVTGPVPQNTGIHDLDTHIDRVIGQSADQGRTVIRRRDEEKKQVIQANPGASSADLSRNTDGSYRVLTPAEKGVHDRANTINFLAMKTRKRQRVTRPDGA